MSSRLTPPSVGSSAAMISISLSRVLLGELDVEDVDAGELLEQAALAFHHRLAGQRADVAQAEHRGAVGDHADQVAARRVLGRQRRVLLDRQAGVGHAGRVGERQVALVGQRLGRRHRDLAARRRAVVLERGVAQRLLRPGTAAPRLPSSSPRRSGRRRQRTAERPRRQLRSRPTSRPAFEDLERRQRLAFQHLEKGAAAGRDVADVAARCRTWRSPPACRRRRRC